MKSFFPIAKLMCATGAAVLLAGCQSSFRVQVSVFNGAIFEHRQAQDALLATDTYKAAFKWVDEQAALYGLDDMEVGGKFVDKLVIGQMLSLKLAPNVDEATKAFKEAYTLDFSVAANVTHKLRVPIELARQLKKDFAVEATKWPKRDERRRAITNMVQEAAALGEAAARLTRRPPQMGVTDVVVLQDRFAEQQARFRKAANEAEPVFARAVELLEKLQPFGKIAGDSLPMVLPDLDDLPREAAKTEKAAQSAQRLVDFDTAMDLSDPNWRYVTQTPEQNWSTVQVLEAGADGEANYVVIQQSMGDFRLKKLFNDPTDAYNAGIKLGKKALETAAKAATAAASGGAALPLLAAGAASTNNSSGGGTRPVAAGTGTLGVELSKARGELDVQTRNRAHVHKAVNDLLSQIDATKPDSLVNATNKLASLHSLLAAPQRGE